MNMGQYDKALAEQQEALRLEPDDVAYGPTASKLGGHCPCRAPWPGAHHQREPADPECVVRLLLHSSPKRLNLRGLLG